MKKVTLYKVQEIEDVSGILDFFGVDTLEEVSFADIHEYLIEEYGEDFDKGSCDTEEWDLIDDDSFLDDRVDMDDIDSGYLIKIMQLDSEYLIWSYFEITDEEY